MRKSNRTSPARRRGARAKRKVLRSLRVTKPAGLPLEQILVKGDLQDLSLGERKDYYLAVCKSLKLNPLTRPFEFIWVEDNSHPHATKFKLILYAKKDCTDQLRKIQKVSVVSSRVIFDGTFYMATCEVKDHKGRTDISTGVVFAQNLKGQDAANGQMWAETKAKRRATLSICGLGMLDESELDTMSGYGAVSPEGRIIQPIETISTETLEQIVARKTAGVRTVTAILWVPYGEGQYSIIAVGKLWEDNVDLFRKYWKPEVGKWVVDSAQLADLAKQFAGRGVLFEKG